MRGILLGLICLTLAACAEDRSFTPTVPEALEIGTPVRLFAATNRAPDARGTWGGERGTGLDLLDLTVSVPPDHQPGELDFAYANPRPETEFTMANRGIYASPNAFVQSLSQRLRALPPDEREVTIFVHGYNATQAETAFRVAQIKHDLGSPGETVMFSWPSRGNALSYAYDEDSKLWSRDALEEVIGLVKQARPKRILIVAHSMGSALVMEVLRQMDIAQPGWPAANLDGVVLMSPDLNVDVFRSLILRMSEVPQPFTIIASEDDKALRLSSRLRGQRPEDRLGTLSDLSKIADLPVTLVDATAFSDDAASSHLVAVTSPGMIAILQNARELNQTFSQSPELVPYLVGGDVTSGPEAVKVEFEPEAE